MTSNLARVAWLGGVAATVLACLAFALLMPRWAESGSIPAPSGPYRIGVTDREIDCEPNIELSESQTLARVPVRIWYPADAAASGVAARYADVSPVAVRPDPGEGFGRDLVLYLTGFLRSHFGRQSLYVPGTMVDPAVAPGGARLPVLLYLASWGGRRTDNTVQALELASHGFVVVGIDDLLPGRPLSLASEAGADETLAWANRKVSLLARAALSVLDGLRRLDRADSASGFAGRLDFERIGLFGYSFGGAVVAEAARLDPRIKAVADLDGWLFGEAAQRWIAQPFLIMYEASNFDAPLSATSSLSTTDRLIAMWEKALTRQVQAGFGRHGGYLLLVDGTGHANFSDDPLLWRLRNRPDTGPIEPGRAARIINAYLVEFFDATLNGVPGRLLRDGAGFDPAAVMKVWAVPSPVSTR